jgi:hypothetical protein
VVRAVSGPPSQTPIPVTPDQTASSTTNPGGPGAPVAAATPFTLKVAVASSGASAVKVTVDGLSAYSGTLTSGQSKEFQVTDTAIIKITKPSQVTVYRDGKKVAMPSGTPATLTLQASAP